MIRLGGEKVECRPRNKEPMNFDIIFNVQCSMFNIQMKEKFYAKKVKAQNVNYSTVTWLRVLFN